MNPKAIADGLLPPILMKGLRRAIGRSRTDVLRFTGDFQSWAEAEQASAGYTQPLILQKTREAMLKVKSGEAAYERDSVVFPDPEFSFPLLAGLLRATMIHGGRLSVLDFGGSLGTSYFQNREFLGPVNSLRWSIVEQTAYVACGKQEFSNSELCFYETIDEAVEVEQPNVLLLSSVIQYLPKPYEFLESVIPQDVPHVIVDRTSFLKRERDRLTVQHVPPSIYPASYPCWFLSESRFLSLFGTRYELLSKFTALDTTQPDDDEAEYAGFLFDLNQHITPSGMKP